VKVLAPQLELDALISDLAEGHPFRKLFASLQHGLGLKNFPAMQLHVTSTIPIAAGLGSGAAVSVAVIRAVSTFLGITLPDQQVSDLAYEVEKVYHGTPSGIDNTVIAFNRPVFFQRGQPFATLHLAAPLTFVIADSGIKSRTVDVVTSVREDREKDPQRSDNMFQSIGEIAIAARGCLEEGTLARVGGLMAENHALLQELGVSCPELDLLVSSALQAGALGAKLCGAGRGGNVAALVEPEAAAEVRVALEAAGAVWTLVFELSPYQQGKP
jgi:mevalonate kinase